MKRQSITSFFASDKAGTAGAPAIKKRAVGVVLAQAEPPLHPWPHDSHPNTQPTPKTAIQDPRPPQDQPEHGPVDGAHGKAPAHGVAPAHAPAPAPAAPPVPPGPIDVPAAFASASAASLPALASLMSEPSWLPLVKAEVKKDYWADLEAFVQKEWARATVFPDKQHIFRALNAVPVDQVKVVILGQDPYHNVGQAEGWCFSVPRGQPLPSSLRNVYKEIASDVGAQMPKHGHLDYWVQQGVLLINTSLTVKAHKANSHSGKGWEQFTDKVIEHLSNQRKGLVFLLWGKHAQKRKSKIKQNKHTVLECAHPSGLSASRGFFGCKHFSKCNEAMQAQGLEPIEWQLPA